MKFIIIFLLLTTNALTQDTSRYMTRRAFDQYEEESKSKALAYIAYFMVPGGGHFYAEESGTGFLYLGVDVALLIAFNEAPSRPDETRIVLLLGLVMSRVLEFINLSGCVDDYNRALRRRLGITFAPDPRRGAQVKLKWMF